MKTLQILETAYRATVEEQDDTIVWLSHAIRDAGAPVDILLRGNAVCYAVKAQDASGLAFGEKKQTQPPRLADDLAKLVAKGAEVYATRDDLADHGIEKSDVIDGLRLIPRADVPKLLGAYDLVWHW